MRHVSLQPPKSIYKSVHTLELGRVTFAESISLSRYFPALRNLEYKFDGSSQGKPAFEELGETVNSLPNGILDTFIIDTLMCNAIGMFGIKLFLDMLEINLSDIHGLDLPRVLGNLRLRTLRLRMTGGNAKRDLVLLDKAGSTGHGGPTRVVLITHGDCDMTNMDFVVSISRACRGLFRGITHFVWSVKGNPAAAISEGKGYGTHDLTISRKLKRLSLTNPSQPARKLDFGVLVERLMKHFPLPRFIYFDMCGESRAYWVINHFDDHPRSKSRKPQPLELHPVIGDFMLKKMRQRIAVGGGREGPRVADGGREMQALETNVRGVPDGPGVVVVVVVVVDGMMSKGQDGGQPEG
ncbi:hypothetical protein CERSUDRAFT_90748 [Gelatoporia subvermispora B]|uniref:Uncharacterized protein n=1 Tax=Ceriporiopsis subvermispora (strain B) TaxID=914234 RepID=M2QYC2_CERS8|nr:hypothetical protein CERSUDRAFT_90748 [Gelatoporia subvermispora B]